jgi:histidinol phosphatase-like enzyme
MSVYVFDLDGTLCKTPEGRYYDATPIKGRIKKVNKLYDQGHTIIVDTARGSETGVDWLNYTGKQLEKWGLKFHMLYAGRKPYGHFYVDDKAVSDKEFFK